MIVRTGIDIGSRSVKLVRGQGRSRLDRITHLGVEECRPDDSSGPIPPLVQTLRRLLDRLHLKRANLGRIAVNVMSRDSSVREVVLSQLTDEELKNALPYEAGRHLPVEEMVSPVLACQHFGDTPPSEEDGRTRTRALLAAIPAAERDFPVQVLARAGLEPEVVDLDCLASLNAMLASCPSGFDAWAILDLGAGGSRIHISQRRGSFLTRTVAPQIDWGVQDPSADLFFDRMAHRVRETLIFYRARYRMDVTSLFLAGGGALTPGMKETWEESVQIPVALFDPLRGVAEGAEGLDRAVGQGARFATACGLCRWWDGGHV